MAVLKLLVSVAVLGTVIHSQDIYTAYSPGQYASAGGTALARGVPRLIPVKVRPSASRLSHSYSSYPSYLHPHFRFTPHSPLSPLSAQSQSQPQQQQQRPSYPRHHQQYRPAMTGYYRPSRPYYSGYESSGQSLGYRAAATGSYPSQASSPGVLKRGRVLSAPSPYAAQQNLDSAPRAGVHYTQSIPAVSNYRPAPPQIQASPVHHVQPHLVQQVQQPQQPQYYVQKAPVGRPLKTVKAVRRPATADPVDDEQEEYPSDPNPQYNFSFDIKDDELTNYQNRQEERDGQTIKGSYSVVDPDGYVRTVTYTADPKNGFQAKVTREPTDVKIKFPVPTEAPQQAPEQQLHHKVAGPQARGQSYIPQGQYQHQPQYQSPPQYQQAAYATPQQTYAAQPSYVPRRTSRFAVQPQAATQPRLRYQRQQHQQ